MITVALIISIVCSWAYFRLLEQPFKKMAAKISYKKEGGKPEVPVPAEAIV